MSTLSEALHGHWSRVSSDLRGIVGQPVITAVADTAAADVEVFKGKLQALIHGYVEARVPNAAGVVEPLTDAALNAIAGAIETGLHMFGHPGE